MLPLFSQQKNFVGCISMEDPIDVARVNEEDLAPLELLASDLAVAIENVNLQQNLVRSEKLASMGQLVTGVAHELNNPLTAVLGHAELLSERAQDSAMQRDLEVIRREALRMKRIIEDMARFSREQSYQRQEVDLAAILNEVVKLRSMEIHNHGADVRVETASDLPRILAAEIQLKQVVLNVLNNSLDALDGVETKRIVLEASSNGHSIILRVTDTGPGFRDTDRAFDPFYTTKAPGKGTGLGLSLTYGIVRDHGGTIRATNLQPNGACMTIELPVHVSTKQK